MERQQPTNEYTKGKYDSLRDQCLHLMTLEAWGNTSSGDVQSPQGFFTRICISEAELFEVVQAFKEQLEAAGLTDPESLIGNYIVRESNDGFVTVDVHDTEDDAVLAYEALSQAYDEWLEMGD